MELLLFFGFILLAASSTEATECCLAYNDVLGNYHSAQWCDDYCCGTTLVGLTCCDSSLLRAPADDRADFCVLWWGRNVWAPILIGLGCLSILICCCVCCYRCCCRSRSTPVIIQSAGQPNVSVTAVNTTAMTNTGYHQPVVFDQIRQPA